MVASGQPPPHHVFVDMLNGKIGFLSFRVPKNVCYSIILLVCLQQFLSIATLNVFMFFCIIRCQYQNGKKFSRQFFLFFGGFFSGEDKFPVFLDSPKNGSLNVFEFVVQVKQDTGNTSFISSWNIDDFIDYSFYFFRLTLSRHVKIVTSYFIACLLK